MDKFNRRVLEIHAQVCKALAHPVRLHILDLLRRGPTTPAEMAEQIGVSRTNISQHLAVMRHAGLVRAVREGTSLRYQVSDPRLLECCCALRDLVRAQLRASAELARHGAGLFEQTRRAVRRTRSQAAASDVARK